MAHLDRMTYFGGMLRGIQGIKKPAAAKPDNTYSTGAYLSYAERNRLAQIKAEQERLAAGKAEIERRKAQSAAGLATLRKQEDDRRRQEEALSKEQEKQYQEAAERYARHRAHIAAAQQAKAVQETIQRQKDEQKRADRRAAFARGKKIYNELPQKLTQLQSSVTEEGDPRIKSPATRDLPYWNETEGPYESTGRDAQGIGTRPPRELSARELKARDIAAQHHSYMAALDLVEPITADFGSRDHSEEIEYADGKQLLLTALLTPSRGNTITQSEVDYRLRQMLAPTTYYGLKAEDELLAFLPNIKTQNSIGHLRQELTKANAEVVEALQGLKPSVEFKGHLYGYGMKKQKRKC